MLLCGGYGDVHAMGGQDCMGRIGGLGVIHGCGQRQGDSHGGGVWVPFCLPPTCWLWDGGDVSTSKTSCPTTCGATWAFVFSPTPLICPSMDRSPFALGGGDS